MPVIRIYGRDNCIWCRRATQLVAARKHEHTYHHVTESPEARAYVEQKLGRTDFTLPQIFVGETLIGGFTELAKADRRDELQQMIGGA